MEASQQNGSSTGERRRLYWRKQLRSGLRWGVAVTLLLVLLPPLSVHWLPVWAQVNELARQDDRLKMACGHESQTEISRWLYTYRFTGSVEHAEFNGQVSAPGCVKAFRIRIETNGGPWRIASVKFR